VLAFQKKNLRFRHRLEINSHCAGVLCALMGGSGAGKTTFMDVVAGM
jgi:ABC-type sulfate/molybdate transport systems ATPase subunit